MSKKILLICFFVEFSGVVAARELYVAIDGNDAGRGTSKHPFLTIQRAADVAQPGDTITVHEGIYREEINPPRGGISDQQRIVFQAAPGETVAIKGSEVVTGWKKVSGNVWKTEIPNTLFGDYNPFAIELKGPWFNPKGRTSGVLKDGEWLDVSTEGGRTHHLGCVYLDGEGLFEAGTKEDLFIEGAQYGTYPTDKAWFAEVGDKVTTVYANFGGANPNQGLTEVNVRETVFYPRSTFVNYITVRGFELSQAAPPWAPPNMEQVALISPGWSKGWIIEDNTITHSINTGITLGKYHDERDDDEASNRSYLAAIDHAMETGTWNREHVGSHIVRNNEIAWCEQAGIVGSMGCIYSEIRGNHIHHIHTQGRFSGAEMAGIKFHAPIGVVIADNHIHDAFIGVWLDWMSQGSRVSRNLFYRNHCHNMYYEVNHGPYLVDNNISLLGNSRHLSQGGAFVHNFIAESLGNWADTRVTPYFKPFTTEKVEDHGITVGDDRFYNNFFVGDGKADSLTVKNGDKIRYYSFGLRCYEERPQLPQTGGYVYTRGAEPCSNEEAIILKGDPKVKLLEENDGVYLEFLFDKEAGQSNTQMVTTKLLGKASVPQQAFTDPNGQALSIDYDYFGNKRSENKPMAGPFEKTGNGRVKVKVWPK